MWGVERAEHRSPRGDSAAGHLGEKSSHKVFVGLEELGLRGGGSGKGLEYKLDDCTCHSVSPTRHAFCASQTGLALRMYS